MSKGGGFTSRRLNSTGEPLTVPCGQCIGCRLERSRQWAVRNMHENALHFESCFITLTYDDDHLPYGNTLVLDHFQLFMKRLRKKHGPVRFFHCGEYGDQTFRPHYHALIYGWRPHDPELFSTKGDHPLYTSLSLASLWPAGHSTFGEVTFDTAAYTARYVTKKITGPRADDHYTSIDEDTGEITYRKPEYCTMSRRPGIGTPWLKKYGQETYTHDSVVMRGIEMKPPRAYDKIFEHTDPQTWKSIKSNRKATALARTNLPTDRQLRAGEIIQNKRLQQRNAM